MRRLSMNRFTPLVSSMLLAAAPAAAQTAHDLPLKHAPAKTTAAITPADLMARLYIFADDSMQGREAGLPGNVKGTNYIAAEIRRLGLVPAGDSGTYFQTIPLKTREFDTTSAFTVGGAPLTAFVDYLPNTRVPVTNPAVPIVFGGDFGDSTRTLTTEQMGGKLVVFRLRGGLGRRIRFPSLPGAVGIALVALDSLPPQFQAFFRRPQAFVDDIRPGGSDDARKQPTPEQLAQVNQRLAAFRAAHPGRTRIDSISNGADDDGSGSVSALEIAESFAAMRQKPKRSLIFVWHVGEEKGLLGSRFFTDHPTVPRDSIVEQLNMDMVGRGDASDETGRTRDSVALHGSPT